MGAAIARAASAPVLPAPPPRRLMAYYQTFCGLQSLLNLPPPQPLTDLHLASLHFGVEQADGEPYLHLNDRYPDDPAFAQVWRDLAAIKAQGTTVRVMLGGAGGGFDALFQHYAPCLALLLAFLETHSDVVTGLDLDVEESVDPEDLQRLIRDVAAARPPTFDFTMAPVEASVSTDEPGMGGFVYKSFLSDSPEGRRVARLNVQCYGDSADNAMPSMVRNGYKPNFLLVGGMADASAEQPAALQRLVAAFPDAGGAYVWELAQAQPSPAAWATAARAALDSVPEPSAPLMRANPT